MIETSDNLASVVVIVFQSSRLVVSVKGGTATWATLRHH